MFLMFPSTILPFSFAAIFSCRFRILLCSTDGLIKADMPLLDNLLGYICKTRLYLDTSSAVPLPVISTWTVK